MESLKSALGRYLNRSVDHTDVVDYRAIPVGSESEFETINVSEFFENPTQAECAIWVCDGGLIVGADDGGLCWYHSAQDCIDDLTSNAFCLDSHFFTDVVSRLADLG